MSNKLCATCQSLDTPNYFPPCNKCEGFSEYKPVGQAAEPTILDSGERREFATGAVRDIQTGKGRCDLLPLMQVARVVNADAEPDIVILSIQSYLDFGRILCLREAISAFCSKRGWSIPYAMLEVSKHFEAGCAKYGERNWEKGIPEHCYIDSAVRHYLKWLDGMTDEPHDRAVVWNLLCLWWTHENITEASDEADN